MGWHAERASYVLLAAVGGSRGWESVCCYGCFFVLAGGGIVASAFSVLRGAGYVKGGCWG